MKKGPSLCLALAFVALTGCKHRACMPAQQHEPANAVTSPPPILLLDDSDLARQMQMNQAVERALQRQISLSSNAYSLDQIIDFIREVTGVNIAVNWPALELVEIDQDSLVDLQLLNVSASKLLELTLEQVSADAFDDDKASYSIQDGMIKVSTIRDLQTDTIIGIYDVGWYILPRDGMQRWLYRDEPRAAAIAMHLIRRRDLIQQVQPPPFDLNDALSSTSSGGPPSPRPGGGVQDKPAAVVPHDHPDAINRRIDDLLELIQFSTGNPDEWLDEESTITAINHQFIIRTTYKNHRAIQQLLTKLYGTQREAFQENARLIEVYLLLDDAEQYRLKQQYGPALLSVEKALRVDPANNEALALRKTLLDTLGR